MCKQRANLMTAKRGFTLIELMVVLLIIGIATALILPNLIASVEQTKAQAVQNNLLAISAAEQKYFEDYSSYCTATTGNTIPCGDTTTDLNANLRLSISDSFTYSCSTVVDTIPYNCQAQDGTDTLTFNPNAAPPANPVSCTNIAGNSGYCP
jgi:prepilin-type N-terminal cleavage/methylation domain-containing protein